MKCSSRPAFFTLALAFALAAGTSCDSKKKKVVPLGSSQMVSSVHGVDYEDKHYRFAIRGLDPKWKLLSDEERAQILPDAAAIVGKIGGSFGAVVVEHANTDSLEDYAELIFSNAAERVSDAKKGAIRKFEFNGGPAIRRNITGKVNSLEISFEYLIFLHQGMAYQVLAWQPIAGRLGSADLEEYFNAVSITAGKVTFPPPPPVADLMGVGSRVANQRFESALSGLSVVQSGDWGLLAGSALEAADDNAEIGLFRQDQGLYITLTSRPLAESSEERYLESVRATINPKATDEEEVTLSVGGETVKCLRVLIPGVTPLRYHAAHFARGGIGYRFAAWHFDKQGQSRSLLDSIQEGLTRVSFMDDAAKRKLRTELEALPDPQGAAGPEFSLRAGTYRDFGAGLTWTKPGGFWKIMTGDQARAQNDSSTLTMKELESGLNIMLIPETEKMTDADAFHEVVVEHLLDSDFEETGEKLPDFRMDGHKLRRTRFHFKGPEADLTYDAGTVLANGKAYQVHVFGPPEAFKLHPALIESGLSGFALPGWKLEATQREPGNTYKDTRMGYRISLPGSAWSISEKKHPVISSLGSSVQYDAKDRFVFHMAMDMIVGGQDSSIGERMLSQLFKMNLDRSDAKGATSTTRTIAGVTATIQEGKTEGKEVRVALFRSGTVIHIGMVLASSKKGVEDLLADYIAGFSFVP